MGISQVHNPAAAAAMIANFKKRFRAGKCMSPCGTCTNPAISAHTLSLSSMLKPITRRGHVYAMSFDLHRDEEGPGKIDLKGTRKTSVFNGFCEHHDSQLFAPIDHRAFVCSSEQIFLQTFRTVAMEAFKKRKQAENFPTLEELRNVHGVECSYTEGAVEAMIMSLRAAEEIEAFKTRLDGLFLSASFSRLVTTIVEFDFSVPIVATFMHTPDVDFGGKQLQDLCDIMIDAAQLVVTVIPSPSGGSFLLFTHEDTSNSAPRRFVDSFCEQGDISSCLFWLIACHTDNFAISPDWYESLSDEDRAIHFDAIRRTSDWTDLSCNSLYLQKLKAPNWGKRPKFVPPPLARRRDVC